MLPAMIETRPPDPESVLRDVFGYDEFRPGQAHIIDAVLAGRDCIGVMPTGAGEVAHVPDSRRGSCREPCSFSLRSSA